MGYARRHKRERYAEVLAYLDVQPKEKHDEFAVRLMPHIYTRATRLEEIGAEIRPLPGVSPIRVTVDLFSPPKSVRSSLRPLDMDRDDLTEAEYAQSNPDVARDVSLSVQPPRERRPTEDEALDTDDDVGVEELSPERAIVGAFQQALRRSHRRDLPDSVAIDLVDGVVRIELVQAGSPCTLEIAPDQPRRILYISGASPMGDRRLIELPSVASLGLAYRDLLMQISRDVRGARARGFLSTWSWPWSNR
jgi:hypothetical protein